MRKLKEYRVYELPGGARPVFPVRDGQGGYALYDGERGFTLPPRFEVKPDGRVMNWHGTATGWTVEDLVDTGREYSG